MRVDRLVVRVEPDGDRRLDARADRPEVVGEVLGRERRADADHAAADVDADRVGRHGVAHGDDRADGRTLAQVDVGHDAHALDPRQRRDVAQLLQRGGSTACSCAHMRVGAFAPESGTGNAWASVLTVLTSSGRPDDHDAAPEWAALVRAGGLEPPPPGSGSRRSVR